MYEDSWYSYVSDPHRKDDATVRSSKNRRKSLLNQTNGKLKVPDAGDAVLDIFGDEPGSKGPPMATLIKRASSFGGNGQKFTMENPRDPFELVENNSEDAKIELVFEKFEENLLDESQEEFQLYHDQLALSERHLDTLLSDTTAALQLLSTLSESFKSVELETTAFQAQCEDLLIEQERVRHLADEIGTELQYYAYLEPLTRRLNAPGSGRVVRSDDFLDMLMNLNTCIDFMDQHPNYRDSTIYKTRYTSLLERSLNLAQIAYSTAFREISDEVSKEVRGKQLSETAEYILLYGKIDLIKERFGPQVEKLLTNREFSVGQKGGERLDSPYLSQYHELYSQMVDVYLKSREPVSFLVTKNLTRFSTTEKPDTDFQSFARRSIQYVLDVCHNEQNLIMQFFHGGPLLAEYDQIPGWNKNTQYAERLRDNAASHLATVHNLLLPYLSKGDLKPVCGLVNWLETIYLTSTDNDLDIDRSREEKRSIVIVMLSKYLWKSLDTLFLNAATDIERFRPSQEDLKVMNNAPVLSNELEPLAGSRGVDEPKNDSFTPQVANAYPTVKTAVNLLVMYNESVYERPRNGDVLYEIVHQATESLQKAATIIKRNSGIMNAQLFLIKNLMLIENLFMTHEIPDSVRQSAEFDFTPIWDTMQELQQRRQLFNPLAYITPLARGKLLPAVVDRILDARKELEKVLVQQITAFTKTWQISLADADYKKRQSVGDELEILLNQVFDDETTRAALWKMIHAED